MYRANNAVGWSKVDIPEAYFLWKLLVFGRMDMIPALLDRLLKANVSH